MEIFFYWCGARVHFEEVGGLLCKKSGPNRYARFLAAGSRSEGQDLIKLRSNPGRWYRIGRLRAIAAYGGGGDRREQGSHGGGLARDAQTGASGVNPTRAWVGEHARGMRKALVTMGWLLGARTGLVAERGGASSPASGFVRPGMRYELRYLAQKDHEAEEVLTELGIGRGGGTGQKSGRTGGGARRGGRGRSFAVRTEQDFPGFLGFTCGRVVSLRSKIRGQLGSISIGREKSRRRSDLTSGRRKAGVRTACSSSRCAG